LKKMIKASFTIEAVFVMPIVLFTMVSIIFLSFFLHDYCRLQGITDHVLHKAIINLKQEGDIKTGRVNYDLIDKGLIRKSLEGSYDREKEIEAYLTKILSKGFLTTRVTDVQASVETLKVYIKVEGRFESPIKGLPGVNSLVKPIVIELGGRYHNPSDTVRISEVILDTGSKVKGYDELMDKLRGLIKR